jgi:DNA adenine methylase
MTLDKFFKLHTEKLDSLFGKKKRKTCWNNLSPIKWIGGKTFLHKWINQHIPNHDNFVEVFGGGASILLSKNQSLCEIYNDIDSNLVNFFRQLRDRPKDLFLKLYFTPYSRAEFDLMRKKFEKSELPDLEKAVIFFYIYINRACFGGRMKKATFGYGTYTMRERSIPSKSYIFEIEHLHFYWNRIKEIIIENLDFRELIKKYDRENTLFYCDPPYFNIQFYEKNFSTEDHEDLAEILSQIKGKFILSYNSHPKLEELYPINKFIVEKKDFVNRVNDTIKDREFRRIEVLIMNFDIKKEAKFLSSNQNTLFDFKKEKGAV